MLVEPEKDEGLATTTPSLRTFVKGGGRRQQLRIQKNLGAIPYFTTSMLYIHQCLLNICLKNMKKN